MSESVFVPGRLPPRAIEAFRTFLRFLFHLAARVHVSGLENIPEKGGFVAVGNHLSAFDSPLGFAMLKGHRVVLMAANKWRKNFLVRNFIELENVIWVDRGHTSPSTIKSAIRVLRDGYFLGIAPEGTRSKDTHALQKGKTGAAYLAMMADVPILPAALTNTENLWDAMKRLRRIDISVTIGKPFRLERGDNNERLDQDRLEIHTDEIMCQIAALLPPHYRGVYADHPRLKELLSENKRSAKVLT